MKKLILLTCIAASLSTLSAFAAAPQGIFPIGNGAGCKPLDSDRCMPIVTLIDDVHAPRDEARPFRITNWQ